MVTPRWPARRSTGHVLELLATENDTSGGSRLTDVKELAARPTLVPSTSAATATTPLGNTPKTSRSLRGSRSWLVGRGLVERGVVVMRVLLTFVREGRRRGAASGPPSRRTPQAGRAGCPGRTAPASARCLLAPRAGAAGAAHRRARGPVRRRASAAPRRPSAPSRRRTGRGRA